MRRVPHSVLHWARHSVQAACRSATGVRRAAFESHSGARQEVQAAWAQRWAGLQCLVQVRAAASHRERRAWPAVRSVYAVLRHAVRVQVQEQPSALAAERAVADAGPRRDAAVRDAEVHRREAPVARARQAAELAAQDRAVKEQHGEALVAARDGRQEPVVRRADAEVLLSVPEEVPPWVVLVGQPLVVLAATDSERACLPGLSADREPPAPSKTTRARRGQIAKRKTRRSRAIPISDSSCPSLVLESCLSTESTTHQLTMCHARNGLTMVRRECGGAHRHSDYFLQNDAQCLGE